MSNSIYLDNNASTIVDPRVFAAMRPVFDQHYGNPASSTHTFGWFAEELVQIAREEVAAAIGAAVEEIVFTSGATEANNLALKGVAAASISNNSPRRHIVSCTTEHKAVLDPLQRLKSQGFEITLCQVNRSGSIAVEDYLSALRPDTLLVSLMLANNEIGVIHDIAKFAAAARSCGAIFHCDATQALGKIPLAVSELEVDLLSLSAHKAYGPKGVGALYVRRTIPALPLEPLFDGGGHEQGLRSGTLNVPAIVGFGKASAIASAELGKDVAHLKTQTDSLLQQLSSSIAGVVLNGPLVGRLPGNLNLLLPGVDNARLIGAVSTKLGISTSSACQSKLALGAKPSHVLDALGLSEQEQRRSIRIGIGRFTTAFEIDAAASILAQAASKLQK